VAGVTIMANNAQMASVRSAKVTQEQIFVAELLDQVADPAAGATVSFSGDVRNHDHDRLVASLTYEAHPSAERVLSEVAASIAERFPVIALAVAHRVGPIPIGESALVAAVSAAHRGEAFAACTELVEQVKAQLPVWKHQVFADGSEEWVNCA
jgi:molybdopterin synthase catalytic subunit